MSKIVGMEDFLKEKDFHEEALPFFEMLDTHYHYKLEESNALFTMPYKQDFLYVFLIYVPRNTPTDKPNIMDRFFNIKTNPRISKGEWVVQKMYTIGCSYHEELSASIETMGHISVVPYLLKAIQE